MNDDIGIISEAEMARALIYAKSIKIDGGFVYVEGRDGKTYITYSKLESLDD